MGTRGLVLIYTFTGRRSLLGSPRRFIGDRSMRCPSTRVRWAKTTQVIKKIHSPMEMNNASVSGPKIQFADLTHSQGRYRKKSEGGGGVRSLARR